MRHLLVVLLLAAAVPLSGCPSGDDNNGAVLIDDDDVVANDDDTAADDDDTAADDDDTAADDDDSALDDDDTTLDDDDSAVDDDDTTLDDDDTAADDDDTAADDDDTAADDDDTAPQGCASQTLACGDVVSGDTADALATDVFDDWGCVTTASFVGPEVVYSFVAPAAGTYTVELSAAAEDLDLFVVEDEGAGCDPAACLDASTSSGGDEELSFAATAGAVYYIVVDAEQDITDAFFLAFDCPACATPEPLTCAEPALFADTADGTNDLETYGCSPSDTFEGPEHVYEFTAGLAGDYTIALSAFDEDLDLLLLDGACDASSCVDASTSSGPDEFLTFTAAAGSTRYVVVDGQYAGTAGEYSLVLQCAGACSDAAPIACDTPAPGDTAASTATLDASVCLGGYDYGAPEDVYLFTASATGPVDITLTGLADDLDLLVYPADPAGGCDLTQCEAASDEGDTDDEELTLDAVAGSSYWVVVDGYEGATSAYSLNIDCSP
jgi:hypothetical protein